MPLPLEVTVVVVPRERFSYAKRSLDALFEHTPEPFDLVYVDGNSPPSLKFHLEESALKRGFRLIRTEYFLTPNEARNLGMKDLTTPYVVFIDNDVHVSKGWLSSLLRAARETGAWVIWPVHTWGPLLPNGEPDFQTVHSAGGKAGFYERNGIRGLYEHTEHSMSRLDSLKPQLKRHETEVAEFHCVMMRRDAFEHVGVFDERLKNTREHTDFCLQVRKAGGTVVIEPESVISYVTAPPLTWSDLPLYLFRWSEYWNEVSLKRINEKWNLNDDYLGLRTNWLMPQRRVALHSLRNFLVRLIGKHAGDAAVDAVERIAISNAMRKRRIAGLDADLY